MYISTTEERINVVRSYDFSTSPRYRTIELLSNKNYEATV